MTFAQNPWLFAVFVFGNIIGPGMGMFFVIANALTGGRARGLDQAELAERIGVGRLWVNQVERGNRGRVWVWCCGLWRVWGLILKLPLKKLAKLLIRLL